jgi:hypothetical protein
LQEINSERCSFAAGILDRGRAGQQNNSGTNSSRQWTKSNYSQLAKIASQVKAVNQQV